MSAWTAKELEAGIARALRAGDMEAAVDLLHALATLDPHMAQVIVDAIHLVGAMGADGE